MTIEFNKVTWYSKLLAVIVFLATFAIAFNLGEQYQTVRDGFYGNAMLQREWNGHTRMMMPQSTVTVSTSSPSTGVASSSVTTSGGSVQVKVIPVNQSSL